MKSVLSEELEAKRRILVKAHNLGVLTLLIIVLAPIISLVAVMPHLHFGLTVEKQKLVIAGVIVLVVLPLEIYGIYWVTKRDDKLCEKLGFICPHCGKPLYVTKGIIHLTGRCPKCGKGVTPQTMRQDERERMRIKSLQAETATHSVHSLEIGTRIRFLKQLTLGPAEDHLQILLADASEKGEITGYATEECYWVKTDAWPKSFGAWPDEFEVLSLSDMKHS